MGKLERFLKTGRNGNAVLFCGAGLTADCLNFDHDVTLGVTVHLLKILNDELKAAGKPTGFKDVKNASKRFKQELGIHRLNDLLKSRFQLSRVSSSIEDIVGYPWSTIYTTNYDDGIELAMRSAGKKYTPINNLDEPDVACDGTPVIHLHGRAEAWDIHTFEKSCVLDADSYRSLFAVTKWLNRLRYDIERAELVVFIGFSAADFHLAQVFFNAAGLKEKAFFINYPTSSPDVDERATQEDFGDPLYIGREGFSELVLRTLQEESPPEPKLASFARFYPPKSSDSVPPVRDIESLFVWGEVDHHHIKRDCDLSKSDYHVLRSEAGVMVEHLSIGGNIVLLHGDICDGKSIAILETICELAGSRPVFDLRHPYLDLLNEVASILRFYPNAILVVENCFTIREERLVGLVRQISGSEAGLILSARSISTEADTGKFKALKSISTLKDVKMSRLQSQEVAAIVDLIDQIAGWKDLGALSHNARKQFVERDCDSILPSVLLRLLKSEYVKDKYRAEYNKIEGMEKRDRQMILAALLISGIGFDAPVSFISEVFERDFASAISNFQGENAGLRLVRVQKGMAKTVPSIGARNLLEHIVDSRDLVDTVIFIIEKLSSDYRRSDFENHLFQQLMRYSILRSVVKDADEINRFFDHISKVSYFREMPLFWLQWHMAMCAQASWIKADDYLKMGYSAADAYDKKYNDKYNRKQLEDRKAKFLAARAIAEVKSGATLFRDIKEALDIVNRLMRDAELTHHPYETLLGVAKAIQHQGGTVPEGLKPILGAQIAEIAGRAKNRINVVPEGYQRQHAENWMKEVENIRATFS